MSRDNQGNYTLPAGNPVVGGTLITTVWANPTMEDIATALQDSLSRTGKGGMQAPLKAVNGNVSAPAYTFTNNVNSGMYLNAPNDVRITSGGVDQIRYLQTGVEILFNGTWYPILSGGTTGSNLETVEITAPQVTLAFVQNIAGASIFINGAGVDRGRLLLGEDYTYDAVNNEITLSESYPTGTKVTALYYAGTELDAAVTAAQESSAIAVQSANAAEQSADDAEQSAIDTANMIANMKGQPDGLASLDSNGKVPAGELDGAVIKTLYEAEPNTNAFTDADKQKLDESFNAGTVMLFLQASAPVGWTKSTTHNNKALRIVSGSGGGSGGSQAFTTAFSSKSVTGSISNTTAGGSVNVNNRTITQSTMPNHSHFYSSLDPTTSSGQIAGGSNKGSSIKATTEEGGGNAHDHSASFSGSSHSHNFSGNSINLAVSYVDSIICTKD